MNNIIWLSGSRGFIGSYLKNTLISMGSNVHCVSNSKNKRLLLDYFEDFLISLKKNTLNSFLKSVIKT